jgi:hypothetical protein
MKRMASLGDLRNSAIRMQWGQVQTAAQALGLEVLLFDVRSAADVVQAFESAGRECKAFEWGSTAQHVRIDG